MVVFFNLQSVLSLRKITKFPATYLGTGWQVFLRPFHGSVSSWEKNHLALWVTKWYLLCKRLESVNDTRDSLLSHLISAWKILQRLEKMNSHLWFSSQGPNSEYWPVADGSEHLSAVQLTNTLWSVISSQKACGHCSSIRSWPQLQHPGHSFSS